MDTSQIDRLIEAVLYEGFILYPYRPSLKNTHRWTFGGVYPHSWSAASGNTDRSRVGCVCIAAGSGDALFSAQIRFLHLFERTPSEAGRNAGMAASCECIERRVEPPAMRLADLTARPLRYPFEFSPAADAIDGSVWQDGVRGAAEISAEPLTVHDAWLVTIAIENETPFDVGPVEPHQPLDARRRNAAHMRSLVSAHAILRLEGGRFESSIDAPGELRDLLDQHAGGGLWPVLAGEPEQGGWMFCARLFSMTIRRSRQKAPAITLTPPKWTKCWRCAC